MHGNRSHFLKYATRSPNFKRCNIRLSSFRSSTAAPRLNAQPVKDRERRGTWPCWLASVPRECLAKFFLLADFASGDWKLFRKTSSRVHSKTRLVVSKLSQVHASARGQKRAPGKVRN